MPQEELTPQEIYRMVQEMQAARETVHIVRFHAIETGESVEYSVCLVRQCTRKEVESLARQSLRLSNRWETVGFYTRPLVK